MNNNNNKHASKTNYPIAAGGSLNVGIAPHPTHAPKMSPQRARRNLRPITTAPQQNMPGTIIASRVLVDAEETPQPPMPLGEQQQRGQRCLQHGVTGADENVHVAVAASGGQSKGVRKHPQPRPPAHKSSGTQVLYGKLDYPNYKCRFCDAMMWKEERRTAATAANLTYTICCQEGKVRLPKLPDTPEPLKHLLQGRTAACVDFWQKIRVYNSMFSFTSFGARIDDQINKLRGPYTFRISGQNYHRLGSLIPDDGVPPRFAQLYFSDTENEFANRMACMNLTTKDVEQTIVLDLMRMIHSHSSVAHAFTMAREWATSNGSMEFKLKLIGERKPTKRQYNLPTVSEVAALIVGDFGQSTAPRDVYVQNKSKGPQRLSELHPLYMALQYPLLFPHGEDGYHENIPYCSNSGRRETKRHNVTMRECYSYKLQQRLCEGTTLLRGGRLYHQYIVDAYTAIEEQRLLWIKFNQKQLRADLYNNICDAVSKGDTEARSVGKRIILPASFTGSPRYMIQNYQDAMALCRAFRNPSLFITFTSNPKWPEVEDMLKELGQQGHDRPDIITRLFKRKLAQLMKDINEKHILGPTTAVVYTIEFQKRGLPHAHILIWLQTGTQAKTASDIDEVISAEIPCKEVDPEAYKVVTEHMLHGPCGEGNKNAPCMSNGECMKHFPKSYYTTTTLDEDGYLVYRRRQDGIFVKKGTTKLDNRHVVPYNRYLLLRYQAHINVEWCNRYRAIKYLFKYISKGPDRTTAVFLRSNNNADTNDPSKLLEVDEVHQFLECRYLSACEVAWRIFAYDIHYSRPAVISLTFHLPEQNPITLAESQDLAALIEGDAVQKTMFTEWFTLNSIDAEARKYTYAEIPEHYVWNLSKKLWTKRVQQRPIGRIVYCHPAAGERYYLRILLNVVRGPQTYTDVKTVKGTTYDSFRQACYARGMLNEDTEWTDAIQEAQMWATGSQLRELFVTILLFCNVTSPVKLWDHNWEALSEDILFHKRKQFRFPTLELSEKQIKNYCLLHIQEILARSGKALSDFPELPLPDKNLLTNMDNRLIQEEMTYSTTEMGALHQTLFQALNAEQINIYNKVLKSVNNQAGEFIFVYGAGGTGKTFLYKTIMAKLRSERKIVLAVASSGIASLLLPGGRTAHSRFVIPIELLEHSTCGITQNSHLAQLMHEVQLIIWDEAPMTQRFAFEALNRTLQDIQGIKNEENKEKLFGGITVLLGGDFRQILPVITKGKRQEIVQACINNSPLWTSCQVLTLTQSMRVNAQQADGSVNDTKRKFNEWILHVGDGKAEALALEEEDEATWINIPQEFIVPPGDNPIAEIIRHVFPDFIPNQRNPSYLQERAILTPLNEDADKINDHMFSTVQGSMHTYKSSDEICMASTDTAEQEHMYPIEFLNKLTFSGMPPHILKLKEGLPVMLMRNVNPTQGLCNGTRLIITHLGEWVVEAEIITGTNMGRKVLIPRIMLCSPKTKWQFVMKRKQFPIKPCFAMTINKSQGQSLKHVGLYLPKPVFCHGQLYVGISRVTDPAGLKILMQHDDKQPKNRTKNIVYREAFNNLNPQASLV